MRLRLTRSGEPDYIEDIKNIVVHANGYIWINQAEDCRGFVNRDGINMSNIDGNYQNYDYMVIERGEAYES